MSAANVALARRGFEAVARGDVDALVDLLDPDVKWHGGDPEASGACQNREAALAVLRAARAGGGGLPALVDVVDAGDRVIVVMESPDGRRVANLTTFLDGKVVEMVHYPHPEAAFAAAGIV